MNIYFSILLLFLPVFHVAFGKEITSSNITTLEIGNATTLLNQTITHNASFPINSRIIVYIPQVPPAYETNEFMVKFGKFLQTFFKQTSQSTQTPTGHNQTAHEEQSVKKKRDLYEFWNAARNISRHAYNSSIKTYDGISDNIKRISPRSTQHVCNDLMCKEHRQHVNITNDSQESKTKINRSPVDELKDLTTGKEDVQLLNEELFEFTTNKGDFTTIKNTEKVNEEKFDLTGNNNSTTVNPDIRIKRDDNCGPGCTKNTSEPSLDIVELPTVANNTDDFFKYRDWLWQHIETARNTTQPSNLSSSEHFFKRHYFLFNSGGTEKSATAKTSDLLINAKPVDIKIFKRANIRSAEPTDDVDFEQFFAQQFRQRNSDYAILDQEDPLKKHTKRFDHGNFNIEKEYNDGGNRPTRPLLLFVTIPSIIGIGVFVLALCFLTRSGGWCCQLFEGPYRVSSHVHKSQPSESTA